MASSFGLTALRSIIIEGRDSVVTPIIGSNASIQKYFAAWQKQAEKYRNGEISKEEYDRWRYNYPKFDTESGWVKVPSQELSDAMVEAFKDHLKDK